MCGPHFRSMKITEDVRKYAAEQGIAEEEGRRGVEKGDGRKVPRVHGERQRALREDLSQRRYGYLTFPELQFPVTLNHKNKTKGQTMSQYHKLYTPADSAIVFIDHKPLTLVGATVGSSVIKIHNTKGNPK